MQTFFTDKAPVSGLHRTADGYLAAEARIARTGIQIYSGAEVGKPDRATVRVYRSPEQVFSADAMASAAHKPITIDHPAGGVDPSTWRKEAVGWTSGEVVRDGGFLRIPMMLADLAAINAVQNGTRELSCGYSCSLQWTPGTTPQGEAFDAQQIGIRLNHVAIVPAGRAGSECRIGDSAMNTRANVIADGQIIAFQDSAEGQAFLARERYIHNLRNQHLGDRAPAWDADMNRAAITTKLAVQSQHTVFQVTDADLAHAAANAAAARLRMIADLTHGRA